jgi:hypothetical protein
MAGVAGSTLVDELNRLANGGATYPAVNTYLEEAGAADKWAGTAVGEMVGALNAKAGNTAANSLGLWGVCNQLAGTSGLSAVDALRTLAS